MAAVTDIKEQYRQDKRFRRYVDRYASGYQSGGRISVEDALDMPWFGKRRLTIGERKKRRKGSSMREGLLREISGTGCPSEEPGRRTDQGIQQ